MERVIRMLTSRWVYLTGLVIAIAAGRTGNPVLYVMLHIFAGAFFGGLLIVSIHGFRKLADTWRKYPITPESKEYTQRKEAEVNENDKNKIELK